MIEGVVIFGKVIGYQEKPWSNGKGMDRILTVSRTYYTETGEQVEGNQRIDVPKVIAEKLGAQFAQMAGQPIAAHVLVDAKAWQNRAFPTFRLVKHWTQAEFTTGERPPVVAPRAQAAAVG